MNMELPLPRKNGRYRRVIDKTEVRVIYVDHERRIVTVDDGIITATITSADFYRQYEIYGREKVIAVLVLIGLIALLALAMSTSLGGPDARDLYNYLERFADLCEQIVQFLTADLPN